MLAITSTDIATLVTVAGAVTPPIGAFLLVIKWIVAFQREITDKYRDELREVRQEFDGYKLDTLQRINDLETKVNQLSIMLEDERQHKAKIIQHLTDQGIKLPKDLERRKATR